MQNKGYPPDHQWTILDIINWTTSFFSSHHIDSPRASAEIFLAHVLGVKRIDLYVRYDQPLTTDEREHFKALVKRRINREPVAYITGQKGFWSLDLIISDNCLIPRPETECLVEKALSYLPQSGAGALPFRPLRILELGTGSGAIILALATERPGHRFFANDRSVHALSMARKNAECMKSDRMIHIFGGDWMAAVKSTCAFDMIISNPPYIPTGTIPTLAPEICRYEPIMALDGGKDGLLCLSEIIRCAHQYLNGGGRLMLEIGHDQGERVRKIAEECGWYDDISVSKDYGGYDRVLAMRKKTTSE